MTHVSPTRIAFALTLAALVAGVASAAPKRTINALFIGNSYTFRNDLAEIVKRLVEEGNPGVEFKYFKIIYGGQTLHTHWDKYRTYNYLKLPKLTKADVEQQIVELNALVQKTKGLKGKAAKESGRYRGAVRNHRQWLKIVGKPQPKWDYVVLQSYRDKDGGIESRYAKYARKFAPIIHELGAKVVLYATSPKTQNAKALEKAPDPAAAIEDTKWLAALGKELDALVVPVAGAIQQSQTARPDLPLRWINDGHLNQQCSYMTGCAMYGAMFDKSPEGLKMNWVNDPRIKNKKKPNEDPDGGPRRIEMPDDVRLHLQKCAWQAVQEWKRLAAD